MKRKKAAMRQTAQEDGRMGRYQVAKKDGFYFAYQEDGGGQDRGPTNLGVFVSEAEARACLRREQKRRAADQKSKRRKK